MELPSHMKHYPQILLIAGTRKKVGKTSLVCSLIKKFSRQQDIIGIKVCPHFHDLDAQEDILIDTPNFVMTEEHSVHGKTDSSRMLNAGASKVYYIQAKDDYLLKAIETVLKRTDPTSPIICESGGLRKYVIPGLFFIVTRQDWGPPKPGIEQLKAIADKWIHFNGHAFDFNIDEIIMKNNRWCLEKEA